MRSRLEAGQGCLQGCTQGPGVCGGDLLGIARFPYRVKQFGILKDWEVYSQKEDIVLLDPDAAAHQAARAF